MEELELLFHLQARVMSIRGTILEAAGIEDNLQFSIPEATADFQGEKITFLKLKIS